MSGMLLQGHLLTFYAEYGFLPAAYAQAAEKDGRTTWGLGLGAVVKESAYQDFDRETIAVPIIFIDNRWIRLAGPDLDIKIGSTEFSDSNKIDYSLRAKFAFSDGYEEEDSDIFLGMAERKASVWVGPSISWENEILSTSF